MNETLKNFTVKRKNPKLLMICGIGGILLIYLSTFLSSAKPGENAVTDVNSISVDEYRRQLENSVSSVVKGITGSENVTVVITLDSGVRYTYADATDANSQSKTENGGQSESNQSKQSFITVKTADGGEKALLVTELMPEVRGVAIVCEGGDDQQTAEKIQSAVMAALGVTSKRVYIAGGSNYEKR